jgi:putative transposase
MPPKAIKQSRQFMTYWAASGPHTARSASEPGAARGEEHGRGRERKQDKTHPGAAASLREGMAETLTILRLGVPPTLARTLRPTNPIESMIEICREYSKNVKRWRDGTVALRWCAAGMFEAGHQFRRVNGHLHLPKLRAALEAHFTENVTAVSQNEDQKVA